MSLHKTKPSSYTESFTVNAAGNHFIKDFSAEKYQSYADLLISEAEKEGIRYNSLFARTFDRVAGMRSTRGWMKSSCMILPTTKPLRKCPK